MAQKRKYVFNIGIKLPSEINNRVFWSFLVINISVVLVAFLSYQQIITLIKNNQTSYQTLRSTQSYFQKVRNSVNQSNILLQNQLIIRNTQNDLVRQNSWKQIFIDVDTLSSYENSWQNRDMRLKFESFIIYIKKLKKVQDETQIVLAVEILPSTEKNPKDTLQKTKAKDLFQNKVLENVQVINQQLDALNLYLSEEFKEKNTDSQYNLSYFWTIEVIFLIFLVSEIAYLGWWVSRRYRKQLYAIEEYIDILAHGDIPEKMSNEDVETYNITQKINSLTEQLQKIKEFAGTVGGGTFDKVMDVFNNEGELGIALAQMQKGLTQIAVRDMQRNWVNEGIALFGNVLREYANAQALYDDIIINLVKYINANQGSIFILREGGEEKENVLEQKALYAYDRERMSRKTIKPGQGLIGQVWLEKDVIYLEEAGEKFIEITSGLGGSLPRCVLIVPMINTESKVLGVVELASFQKFDDYEIDFVKRVCEMMVSAISALQNNDKTRRLLEEAQRNSQRASVQEQETRQNQQRLTSVQDEITRLKNELENRDSSLERTLAYLEVNLRDEILVANNYFLDSLRYDLAELEGQNLSMLFKDKAQITTEYQKIWQALRNGDNEEYTLQLLTKNGEDVWFDATFTPIFDEREIVQKIVILAIETTEKRTLIQQQQNKWEAVSKGVPIAEMSLSGIFITANESFLKNTGYKLDEITGQSYNRFLPEQNAEQSENEEKIWQKLTFGDVVNKELTLIARNGHILVGHATFSPVSDFNGKPAKILLVWKI
ncbi:MAG: PAS domain-containing protein [Bacteroidetes bacterium]|nr:MAG: PAS domain-containing protein [Bacteroidota bacterium]TAG89659.1 MAG: PAS domain-containing protein [Bacteroidota bacterium]